MVAGEFDQLLVVEIGVRPLPRFMVLSADDDQGAVFQGVERMERPGASAVMYIPQGNRL